MNDKPIVFPVDLGQRREQMYIGYSVQADHDNEQIWLSTIRDGQLHEIALYPEDLAILNFYAKKVFP